MKGYKIMNPDMTCRGFKYEIGKTYKQDGKVDLCGNGFHFCKELSYCYNYYDFDKANIVCEVEALGEVEQDEYKTVTNEIKIVRKIEIDEILELLNLFTSSNRGSSNRGSSNQGSFNWGKDNSGSFNFGKYNDGSRNQGEFNSGSSNNGKFNYGSFNEGSRNRGSFNKGQWNFASNCVGVMNCNSFVGTKENCACFNIKTGLSLIQFYRKYLKVLKEIRNYDFKNISELPNYTQKKWDLICKSLRLYKIN